MVWYIAEWQVVVVTLNAQRQVKIEIFHYEQPLVPAVSWFHDWPLQYLAKDTGILS